jgi:hypothetical protein
MDQHRGRYRQPIRHALRHAAVGAWLTSALVGGAAGAIAGDFVVNVPVELEAMEPEVHTVQVSCYVHGAAGTDAPPIGSGEASVPMPESGDFNGVVRVPITLQQGKERREARAYVCNLMFPGGSTMEAERDRGTPGAQASPGTTPVLQIRGVLPR